MKLSRVCPLFSCISRDSLGSTSHLLFLTALLIAAVVLPPSFVNAAPASPKASNAEHGGDIRGAISRCESPLQRALISLAGHSFMAKTDSDGKFYLHYVQPGSYKLLIEDGEAVLSSIDNVAVTKKAVTDIGAYNFCPDSDNDGFDEATDCNDQNPSVYPGAAESCDGVDNNCDGVVDESCPTCTDADSDGFFAQAGCNTVVDCDDLNAATHPAASEVCHDGIDNNCNSIVDENCLVCIPGSSCDTGSIGQCAAGAYDNSCTCVAVTASSDEVCDSIDNDCDGQVDQGNPGGGVSCDTGFPGICALGETECQNGGLTCLQSSQAAVEVCDSLDNDCDGQVDEGNVCGTDPVDCVLSDWSGFSQCSATCGGGVQTRTRSILVAPANGGTPCGALVETVPCNTQPCPIDCVVSEWSAFSACSAECGGGTQTRVRSVLVASQFGGASCPTLEETQACNTEPCVVDTFAWEVGAFGTCSVTCGGGVRTRTVSCVNQSTGAVVSDTFCADAGPKPATQESCNTDPCTPTLTAFESGTLDAHNAVRAQVSAGTFGTQPQAEPDLAPMSWDAALASAAADWASTCTFGYNSATERQQSYAAHGGNLNQGTWIGANIFAMSGANASPSVAVNTWVAEADDYNYATNTCSGVCGHYTQVVWDDSVQLGCARVNCPTLTGLPGFTNADLTVCFYYPGGNFNGQRPYSTL